MGGRRPFLYLVACSYVRCRRGRYGLTGIDDKNCRIFALPPKLFPVKDILQLAEGISRRCLGNMLSNRCQQHRTKWKPISALLLASVWACLVVPAVSEQKNITLIQNEIGTAVENIGVGRYMARGRRSTGGWSVHLARAPLFLFGESWSTYARKLRYFPSSVVRNRVRPVV